MGSRTGGAQPNTHDTFQSRVLRVVPTGKPEKPVVAEAPRSRLPKTIRVHTSIATALSNSDVAGVTRGVQELEESIDLAPSRGGVDDNETRREVRKRHKNLKNP